VASLLHAKADLGELEAHRVQAEQEWKRAQELLPAKAIAPTDYDLDKAAFDAAVANLEVGKATVKQNEAALELAKTNVDYCIIKSPVKGVIIDRRVNVGETVVSSLNAPSLFLIAKDLTRMQVWASVNEADIGRIHVGLPVTFTCDAFPHHTFKGAVSQIRYNATMTQNVVTYTVVVTTDNSKGTLLPYLTANVLFQIEDHRGVLKVPNAALRWKPRPTQIAADIRDSEQLASRDGSAGKVAGGPSGGGSKDMAMAKSASGGSRSKDMVTAKSAGDQQAAKPAKDRGDRGRLWVNDGGFVRPLDVQIVASDGTSTEVSGSGVEEGLDVVTGEITAAEQSSGETNPFAPKLFKGAAKSR
jgi:HlyD family secretion protein